MTLCPEGSIWNKNVLIIWTPRQVRFLITKNRHAASQGMLGRDRRLWSFRSFRPIS